LQPPKQKQPMKKPKVKDKSIVRAKSINRATNSSKKYIEIKENSEAEYATNRMEDITKDTAETGVDIAYRGAKIGYQKSKQIIQNQKGAEALKQKVNIDNITKKAKMKTPKNAIFTGKKNPVKSGTKGVKQSSKAVKSTSRGIKTASTTAKSAKSMAKTSAIASKKAMIVAKQTIIATKQATVATYNAVKVAIKAMIEAIKGVIVLIAAGGWVAVLVIVIIGAIGVLIASPFGLFFNEGDEDYPSISQVVTQLNAEYTAEINKIIAEAGEVDQNSNRSYDNNN